MGMAQPLSRLSLVNGAQPENCLIFLHVNLQR